MQREHTEIAVERAKNPDLTLAAASALVDDPRRRSWRPFQLAFVLLNLPSLTDPKHPDRALASATNGPGLADLLFFPTGGGKTEAYLGLTAFTLAIRRLQGVIGEGSDARDGRRRGGGPDALHTAAPDRPAVSARRHPDLRRRTAAPIRGDRATRRWAAESVG